MRVHVAFTPDEAAAAPTGIVIDVLRATSTIAQALAAGYERVLCVRRDRAGARAPRRAPGQPRRRRARRDQDRRLRRGCLAARVSRGSGRDADPLDDERDALDRHRCGALPRGAAREPAQPRRRRARRDRARGRRGNPLRRLQGRVRARRRVLRRPDRAAVGRRAQRRRRRGGGACRRLPGRALRADLHGPTDRPASRRTSRSVRGRACSRPCRVSPACVARPPRS